MLNEENDIRIREAANQYHPAYDDIAWVKMEQMLDEHLPQKKTGRRKIFLLPLMLLLGGLILFIISDNEKKPVSQSATKQNTEVFISPKPSSANSSELSVKTLPDNKPGYNKAIPEKLKTDLQLQPLTLSPRTQIKKSTIPVSVSIIENSRPNYKKNLQGTPVIVLKQQSTAEMNKGNAINKIDTTTNSINNESQKENTIIADKNESTTVTPKANTQTTAGAKTEIKEEKPSMSKIENGQSETSKKKIKSRNGFQNNFAITLSAGPDASGVRVNNVGKLTMKYGAGLSYSILNQLAIRSGFYVSKKIYSAGPNDYHEAGGSGYDYLKNVDANCTVYEIPINFDYSFGAVKNHNWFVSTGLSSYLMKKETYDYYYKTPAGDSYNKNSTISNKNQHFFSVLNLSGGYQYSFNKQFSIMAEPYVNLPLSGIGAGKVKLNSGGILFTLKTKPFSKKW